jgi:putative lipoprotein
MVICRRLRAAIPMLGLLLGACGNAERPAGDDDDVGPPLTEAVVEGTFHGTVTFDATTRRFEPCNGLGGRPLAVEDAADGELLAAFQELAGQPGAELYVEVKGRVEPISRGVLGTGPDRQLVVTEVRRATAGAAGCEDDLDGVTWRASGNEPFWRVDVTSMDITLVRPDAGTISFPYEPARDSAGTRIITTAVAGGPSLRLELVEERCVDSMSGFWQPFRARLILDGGEPLDGCAVEGW